MDTAEEFSSLLKVLANPVRLKILALCLKRERTSRELREKLRLSKPLLIVHVKKLLNAGFLSCRIRSENGRIVKYYRTERFEVCCGEEILRDILEELEGDGTG